MTRRWHTQYVLQHLEGSPLDSECLPAKPFLVSLVRNSRFAMLASSSLHEQPRSVDEIFTFLAGNVLARCCDVDDVPRDLTTTEWFTPLLHKLVILASLTTQVALLEGEARDILVAAKWLPVVRERTTKWVRGGMGTDDVRLRNALRHVSLEYETE